MLDRFEAFVASRYLRAKRKQAVISVITVISIAGVAAGVMALVVALAINAGFRNTLQRNLLGATAHVSLMEKARGSGIENYRDLAQRIRALRHVTSVSPSLYGYVLIASPYQPSGAIVKGVDLSQGSPVDKLVQLKKGSLEALNDGSKLPGIVLGSRLAESTGMMLGSRVSVISPEGDMTPVGMKPNRVLFRVVGIFESGFYELDNLWAFTTLKNAQTLFGTGDVVNSIEVRLDDIDLATQIARQVEGFAGKDLAALDWKEQNKPILSALQMEKAVTVVTIGLIQLVGALNILIALIMMVMEKHKDIAVLMSMGARHQQIRRIFMLQGVFIGVIGTVIGLISGYAICYFADRYRWIRLNQEVYSLSFVPFEPRWTDGLWIAAIAILVSFVATIYPARSASRIAPAESLRYE